MTQLIPKRRQIGKCYCSLYHPSQKMAQQEKRLSQAVSLAIEIDHCNTGGRIAELNMASDILLTS